jgi:hypothetical protein
MQSTIKLIVVLLLSALSFGCSNSTQGSKIQNKIFDASTIKKDGVEILTGYSATPKDGILDTFSVTLPEYESVVYISGQHREKFLDAMNRVFSWAAPDLKTIVSDDYNPDPVGGIPSRNGLLALFKLKNNEYLLLQGISSPEAMSYLVISDEGKLHINLATFGVDPVSGDIPLVTYARGANVYDVFQQAWKNAINTETLKGRTAMRHEKEYPEMFEYLGWCSWEQYRINVSSDLMVDAMQKIEKSPIPIRWVLLDNGYQHSYKTADGMNSSRMLSFNANPETFPNGFTPLMNARTEKVKWTGLWYTMNAHWQGLHPEHEIRELDPYLVKIRKNEGFEVMMPKGDSISSHMFYHKLIGSSKEHGFDFVKIDNQNRQLAFYKGMSNPVKIVSQHAQSMEASIEELSGGLMNCFCLDLLSLMNTRHSAVGRVSIDYLLNNEVRAKSHLIQSYQNTLWMGQAVWPDHDMFHSSDKFAGRIMAISKAMSGAPIYLSDAPDDFLEELVMPLCMRDGKLYRPLAPAIPLPESVTISALSEAKAYRVIAPLANGAAAIVAYNLTIPTPSEAIKTQITAADYTHAGSFIQPAVNAWRIPKEGLVYYDWYEGKGGLLNDVYPIELNGFSDRLVQLSPVVKGWSVVGCTDKYLSAAAIETIEYEENEVKIKMAEAGTLVVYNSKPVTCTSAQEIEDLGNGLWKIYFPGNMEGTEVVVGLK